METTSQQSYRLVLRSTPSFHGQRPVIFSCSSGYRSPCTLIFDAAVLISFRSSGESSIAAAPIFSSNRDEFRRSRDGNDPRLLRQQPGQCDLGGGCTLSFCNLSQQINQGLIRFASLWCKTGQGIAEVGLVEGSIFTDLSGKETPAKRAEWNEPDPKLLEGRQQFFSGASTTTSIHSGQQ